MKKLFFTCCMMFVLTLSAQTYTIVDDQPDQIQLEEENVTVDTVIQNVNVLENNLQSSINLLQESTGDFLNLISTRANPYVVDLDNKVIQVNNSVVNNINNNKTTDLITLLVNQSKSQYSAIMERKNLD